MEVVEEELLRRKSPIFSANDAENMIYEEETGKTLY